MSVTTIALSTTPGPRSSLLPVLHPPSGAPVTYPCRLPPSGLSTLLPTAVINQAILMVGNADTLTVLIDKTAAPSFEQLGKAWQFVIATREFSESGPLINIPDGAWKLILDLSDGTIRGYRHFGRQAHVNPKGYGIWIPGFVIDECATRLPDIPGDILDRLKGSTAGATAGLARQDLARWFWEVANPGLEDPFVADSHPELGLLSEITWKVGSLNQFVTTLNHIFWSDPLFVERGDAAVLEVTCLIDHNDQARDLRFARDVACDDKRARRLLVHAVLENQPVCHRMQAGTSRISGLTPGRTALTITIDPPSAHQIIEAEAAMEVWLRKRGL